MILCFRICGNSFGEGPFLFQNDNAPPCTKRGLYRKGLSRLVWKNLTGLHIALTSTLLNTFWLNWNADCEPGLIAQHQCPTSLMLLWLNRIEASARSNVLTSSRTPSQNSGGCSSITGGTNSILMPMILVFITWSFRDLYFSPNA
jgi:hypothetical protein